MFHKIINHYTNTHAYFETFRKAVLCRLNDYQSYTPMYAHLK